MKEQYPDLDSFLFPDVLRDRWQMSVSERIALTGVLARIKPRLSLEIGVYWGGSSSLTVQYSEELIAVDIDPKVRDRFSIPSNLDLRIGNSTELIPAILKEIAEAQKPLAFVLIDADHTASAVRRDIELVLAYQPI